MARKKKSDSRLLSDEPVLEAARTDELQFGPAAEVLARAALHTDSPMTIGVFGNWGSGKTSLMRLMYKIVDTLDAKEGPAVAVWFNPWQYEPEKHLIIPLIATIACDIKENERGRVEIGLNSDVRVCVDVSSRGIGRFAICG